MKKGSKSKEAIKVFNYIAWFNGSDYRVPPNTKIDIFEKPPVNRLNASHSRTILAESRFSLNTMDLTAGS